MPRNKKVVNNVGVERTLEKWEEIKIYIQACDLDVHNNLLKGNLSAGRRIRNAFREIKKLIHQFQMEIMTIDKNRIEQKENKADK